MDLRTYTTGNGREAWEEAARRLRADAYFLPGYAAAHEAIGDGEAVAFHAADGPREGLEVVMVRPLSGLEFLAGDVAGLRDAASAYGYGGPFFNDAARGDAGFVDRFHAALAGWCRGQRIVARFVRFHPLLENHRGAEPHMVVDERQPTVVIDLAGDAGPGAGFRATARRHLRHAVAAGLAFEERPTPAGLEAFQRLYDATMKRVGARPYYFFPRRYYETLAEGLGPRLRLWGAFLGDHLAAAGLFLVGPEWVHYHLGASDEALLPLRPNNLLFHGAAEEAKRLGCRRLHLGGGLSGEDSLYRFKRSLSRGEARFRAGRQILDAAAYAALVAEWERWTGARSDPEGYFPAYRAGT